MTTPLRAALVPKSPLLPRVKDGLRALEKKHLGFIEERLRAEFDDSLALDEALRRDHEQEDRWDYLIGHGTSGQALGLEPHSAKNDQISTVIKKREMALSQLRGHLKPGKHVAGWFWVASGKVDFLPMEKATARLAANGIKFVGKVLLERDLPISVRQARTREPIDKKSR